jgi:hypothetical protein
MRILQEIEMYFHWSPNNTANTECKAKYSAKSNRNSQYPSKYFENITANKWTEGFTIEIY